MAEEFTVTPWDVSGHVDYDKLIQKFGTKRIDASLRGKLTKDAKDTNVLLSREFFFSHRDLDLALKDYEAGKGFFLYTGRGPSGPMHIGHLMPLMFTKWLQDQFGVNVYIELTDDEKYWVKDQSWEEIQKWSYENALDIAAVGFDPEKTFMFKDSEYIKNVYPLMVKVAKKVNNTTVKAVFGFSGETNIGLNFYPAYQTMPTFFEKKRCLIPCAIDQDNYWRIQRDVAESLGYFKTAALHCKFLPPLTGMDGKMSASQADTAIWLTDDAKTVRKKVMKYAFSGGKDTVEEHRAKGGNPDIDVSFQWMKIFFEANDKTLAQIEKDYRAGKILSGEMKQLFVDRLNTFLAKHQEQRLAAASLVEKMMYKGKLAQEMWKKTYQ